MTGEAWGLSDSGNCETEQAELPLAGERVAVVGPLGSMTRRDAVELVRRGGGEVARQIDAEVTLIVLGDAAQPETQGAAASSGSLPANAEVIREAELWQRLGLVDCDWGVHRHYTPAMLADLVGVPAAVVRRWGARGLLSPSQTVGRLPYFAFGEVAVARRLAELLTAGCSMARIERIAADLEAGYPGLERPLAELPLVVDGGVLRVRHAGGLAEPSGQRLLAFTEHPQMTSGGSEEEDELDSAAAILPLSRSTLALEDMSGSAFGSIGDVPAHDLSVGEDFDPDHARSLAADLETAGDLAGAIAARRAVLMSGAGDAEDQFALAELLYRTEDLPAARERYYAALEWDEDFAEARANLGCVLAELGDQELAAAALKGALERRPDFADARYHLAETLEGLGRVDEAIDQWRRFLATAPQSAWTEEARRRLDEHLGPGE